MIGGHLVGLLAGAAQPPFEERLSRLTVTVIAEEYVEHLPMLVNGPVQVSGSPRDLRPGLLPLRALLLHGAAGLVRTR